MSNHQQIKKKKRSNVLVWEMLSLITMACAIVYFMELAWWWVLFFLASYIVLTLSTIVVLILYRSKMKKKHKEWFSNGDKDK